jgi:hexosaminidase
MAVSSGAEHQTPAGGQAPLDPPKAFDTLLPRPVAVLPLPGVRAWPAPVDVRDTSDLPAEGYRLEIDPGGVTLHVADAAGEVNGRQTLRQLIGPDAFRAAPVGPEVSVLPCGIVEDHPRFGWRGCLLDVARHFRTKAEVLRFVDLLSAHKLNVLNLHLTDDQGWRMEVPRFPLLTSVGGWRRSSMVGRHDGPERDGRPHGGFYTTDDLREIVAYAASRAVTVVPEIDIPGHARAAIAAYPALGPAGDSPGEVWTSWGISTSLLDPSQSTLDFFRQVFDHVLRVRPGHRFAPGVTRPDADGLGRGPGDGPVAAHGDRRVAGGVRGRAGGCGGPRRGAVPGGAGVPGPPPVRPPGRADPGGVPPHPRGCVRL